MFEIVEMVIIELDRKGKSFIQFRPSTVQGRGIKVYNYMVIDVSLFLRAIKAQMID